MTTYRVDPEQVQALGAGLVALAEGLAAQGESVRSDAWALGDGVAARAFDEAVTHWRHERLLLARALDELGRAASAAGGVYVDVETAATGRLTVGGDR